MKKRIILFVAVGEELPEKREVINPAELTTADEKQ